MILNLNHIYKDYQQEKLVVPVLKDVSLTVEKGEYVAIMGPSGSGKTTLMNIIGCLDLPTSGSYELSGNNVLKYKDRELADVRLNHIGFVFQSFHLLPRSSALENVALPLIYAGVKKQERLKKAAAALGRVGLADRVDFKPTQLSGGQKQRVAIARAMVNDPEILLADEPTGALDTASGKQIMELFEKLNEEGVTIVMITHDENIASHAKRMIRIIDGEVFDKDGNRIQGTEASGETVTYRNNDVGKRQKRRRNKKEASDAAGGTEYTEPFAELSDDTQQSVVEMESQNCAQSADRLPNQQWNEALNENASAGTEAEDEE